MRVITKAEFAREAGVNPSAITRASSTILQPALAANGIDADHPAALEYLSRSGNVGRPRGGSGLDIEQFVMINARKLEALELSLGEREAPLVKNISDHLFSIGCMPERMRQGERTERMRSVTEGLNYLSSLVS